MREAGGASGTVVVGDGILMFGMDEEAILDFSNTRKAPVFPLERFRVVPTHGPHRLPFSDLPQCC